MMRTIFLSLLIWLITLDASAFMAVLPSDDDAAAAPVCSVTPFLTVTGTGDNDQITATNAKSYDGGVWTGAAFTLCRVDVNLRTWVGDITAYNYRIDTFTVSGTALDVNTGNSDQVSGSTFTSTITYTRFDFSTPVTVNTGDAIVFSETTHTVDGTNYMRVYNSTAEDTALNYSAYNGNKTRSETNGAWTPSWKLYAYE